MFIEFFVDTIHNVWPMLFIFSVIIISFRLMYLIYNKEKLIIYKEVLMFIFIIYILLLYYIVSFQDNNYGTSNFIPFKEIFRYDISSSLFLRNVVGNILLFMPFGLFATLYIKNKNFLPILFLSIMTSISIEVAQTALGRTADIDDVILNTVGGVLGYFTYKYGKKLVDKLPKVIKNDAFLNIVTILLIAIIIILIVKFELWRIVT